MARRSGDVGRILGRRRGGPHRAEIDSGVRRRISASGDVAPPAAAPGGAGRHAVPDCARHVAARRHHSAAGILDVSLRGAAVRSSSCPRRAHTVAARAADRFCGLGQRSWRVDRRSRHAGRLRGVLMARPGVVHAKPRAAARVSVRIRTRDAVQPVRRIDARFPDGDRSSGSRRYHRVAACDACAARRRSVVDDTNCRCSLRRVEAPSHAGTLVASRGAVVRGRVVPCHSPGRFLRACRCVPDAAVDSAINRRRGNDAIEHGSHVVAADRDMWRAHCRCGHCVRPYARNGWRVASRARGDGFHQGPRHPRQDAHVVRLRRVRDLALLSRDPRVDGWSARDRVLRGAARTALARLHERTRGVG